MPSSAVRTFADPDEFASSVRQGSVELTVTGNETFSTELVRIDLHRMWMQHFSETTPRIMHVSDWGGRTAISFQTQPGPPLVRCGIDVPPDAITRHGVAQSYYVKSCGTTYGTMSLAIGDMAEVGSAVAGCDLAAQNDTQLITPPPVAMARLKRLHAAAVALAKDAPEVIVQPEAARGLEQALIEAMVDCLSTGAVESDRTATRQHTKIMRRFYRMVNENPEEPLYIPELCVAVGASERTLRICCTEQIGMAPKHYLTLRRLNFARRALVKCDPTQTSVTDIATRYGFWQFGRFAGEYKAVFGELPSTTLARPAGGE